MNRTILAVAAAITVGCSTTPGAPASGPLSIHLAEPVEIGPDRIRLDISVRNRSEAPVTVYGYEPQMAEPHPNLLLTLAGDRRTLEANPFSTPGRYYLSDVILGPGETLEEYDEVDTSGDDRLFLQAWWFSLDCDSDCRSNVVEWSRDHR